MTCPAGATLRAYSASTATARTKQDATLSLVSVCAVPVGPATSAISPATRAPTASSASRNAPALMAEPATLRPAIALALTAGSVSLSCYYGN